MSIRRYIEIVEGAQSGISNETIHFNGIPMHVDLSDSGFKHAVERRAYQFRHTPGLRDDQYEIEIHPTSSPNIKVVRTGRRDQVIYYDPRYVDIEVADADDPHLAKKVAVPRRNVVDQVPGIGGSVMYRGMSFEEFDQFQKTGEIRSFGSYNLSGQEGLTYWSKDVGEAQSYASSFAPWSFKPTFDRPAFVVAARMPAKSDIRHVQGTGANEIGVARAITADEVVAVWRGRVIIYRPGSFTVNPPDWSNDKYRIGSSSTQSVHLHWEQVF